MQDIEELKWNINFVEKWLDGRLIDNKWEILHFTWISFLSLRGQSMLSVCSVIFQLNWWKYA